MGNIFDEFTRKYALSKTLRFELKPVGKKNFDQRAGKEITMTEKFLLDNNVFEKDKTIDDSYNQAKFYFDTLHQKFINSALASENVKTLQFSQLADFLEDKNKEITCLRKKLNLARQEKANTKPVQDRINKLEEKMDDEKEKFYKVILGLLDDEAEKWKNGYIGKKFKNSKNKEVEIKFGKEGAEEKKNQKGVGFLTSARVLQILISTFVDKSLCHQKNFFLSSSMDGVREKKMNIMLSIWGIPHILIGTKKKDFLPPFMHRASMLAFCHIKSDQAKLGICTLAPAAWCSKS